jgi:hypothetical protein
MFRLTRSLFTRRPRYSYLSDSFRVWALSLDDI